MKQKQKKKQKQTQNEKRKQDSCLSGHLIALPFICGHGKGGGGEKKKATQAYLVTDFSNPTPKIYKSNSPLFIKTSSVRTYYQVQEYSQVGTCFESKTSKMCFIVMVMKHVELLQQLTYISSPSPFPSPSTPPFLCEINGLKGRKIRKSKIRDKKRNER